MNDGANNCACPGDTVKDGANNCNCPGQTVNDGADNCACPGGTVNDGANNCIGNSKWLGFICKKSNNWKKPHKKINKLKLGKKIIHLKN